MAAAQIADVPLASRGIKVIDVLADGFMTDAQTRQVEPDAAGDEVR